MISSHKRSNLPLDSSIWIDSTGIIYFIRSNKVRKYDPIKRSAGNGDATIPENGAVATSTGIGSPSQIWVNVEGHFFFADSEVCNVYEVNKEGRIYKILGTGSYGRSSRVAKIGSPVGIVGDSRGNIYVAVNGGNGVIYKLSDPVNYDYKIEYFAGVKNGYSLQGSYGDGDGLLATLTHFTFIASIGIDSHSNIYVEDGGSKVIRKIDGASGMTRIVVDQEVYDQFDCSSGIDDYDIEAPLRRMYVNNEGGVFIYRCSHVRYIAPDQLLLHSSRALSSASSAIDLNMIFFPLVGILFVLFAFSFRKMMRTL